MIRAILITALAASLSYAACDAADPLNRTTTTTKEPTMPVETRTVYRLRIQDVENGALLADPTGPFCSAPETAKTAELVTEDGEQLVLTSVLQRRGGDGCWHTTDETVTEVL